jgi:hypothetical protein
MNSRDLALELVDKELKSLDLDLLNLKQSEALSIKKLAAYQLQISLIEEKIDLLKSYKESM